MPSLDEIYFDLFKRNMDTRRAIILGALTAVLLLGAWTIQREVSIPIVSAIWELRSFAVAADFIVGWAAYFVVLAGIDANVSAILDKLQAIVPFDHIERAEINKRLNKNAKYAPFAISFFTNVGIVAASIIRTINP